MNGSFSRFIAILFAVVCLLPLTINAQTIEQINFSGLKRTRAHYLRDHIIQQKVGQQLDSNQLEKDAQEIYNIRHFSDVDFEVTPNPTDSSKVSINFHTKETISIIPVLEVGATRDFFKLKIGYTDFNMWGRSGLTNLCVQQFGRITYFFTGDYPFVFGGKHGMQMDLYKAGTIEPIYYNGQRNEFNYDLDNFMLFHRYDFDLRSFLKTGIGFQYEDFIPKTITELPANYPLKNTAARFTYRLHYRYSKINLERITQEGYYFDATLNGVHSLVDSTNPLQGSGAKLLLDGRAYKTLYSGANVAARLRLGLGKNALFDQFTLDDNTNIRGIGFKRVRRNYEFVVNLEYRQTVLKHRLGIVQAVAFNDFTIGRDHFGGGLHFYIEPIHGVVFRIDYGMNIQNIHDAGIVAGIHQYF